jgi:hypothetical protein
VTVCYSPAPQQIRSNGGTRVIAGCGGACIGLLGRECLLAACFAEVPATCCSVKIAETDRFQENARAQGAVPSPESRPPL